MLPRSQVLSSVLALLIAATALAFLLRINSLSGHTASPLAQEATSSGLEASAAAPLGATTTTKSERKTKVSIAPVGKKATVPTSVPATPTSAVATTNTNQVARIENPYSSAPGSSDAVNTAARAALVNILCLSSGSVRPISGSGVIIDPRGVILTNAHVAQYVLLAENPAINLSCVIRRDSPARSAWQAGVLYIPPVWVAEHANELNTGQAVGTGEHDYALLLITGEVNGASLPAQFPFLAPDTRNAIGFPGDQVLVAAYGAEFLGAIQAEHALYAASSLATIGQPFTFGSGTIDVMSLGGIIEAQSGSSGGAVVNPWGRLIGLITTTSEGATTAERDLHALTLYYINTDLQAQTGGSDLATLLAGNLYAEQADFNMRLFPTLMDQYMTRLKTTQQ